MAVDVPLYDPDGRLVLMPSVYSLAFSETNKCFDETRLPDSLLQVSATRAEFDDFLRSIGAPSLPVEGERKLGLLDLLHVPLLQAIIAAVNPTLPGITSERFDHIYPLHGSSAGIGLLMNHLRTVMHVEEIHILAGDYEGYAAQAGIFGIRAIPVQIDDAPRISGQTWFISNPSAIDGEPLPAGFVESVIEHNRVVVDVAYHGLQGSERVTAVPEGAWAALWSLSKPWGLFWRRVGILLATEEIPGAYGTRWYKDPARLIAAHAVVTRFPPGAMADRYRWAQNRAIDVLHENGIPASTSATVLLALIQKDDVDPAFWDQIYRAERCVGSGIARVCLTPLMENILRADDAQLDERITPPLSDPDGR